MTRTGSVGVAINNASPELFNFTTLYSNYIIIVGNKHFSSNQWHEI